MKKGLEAETSNPSVSLRFGAKPPVVSAILLEWSKPHFDNNRSACYESCRELRIY